MSGDLTIPDKDEFKIGEVCEIAGVKPFVLRYWETEFSQLAPAKGTGGQRTYSRADVDLILHIKRLLYEERFTVAGAKRKLTEEGEPSPKKGAAKPAGKGGAKKRIKVSETAAPLDTSGADQVENARRVLGEVRRELEVIMESLK